MALSKQKRKNRVPLYWRSGEHAVAPMPMRSQNKEQFRTRLFRAGRHGVVCNPIEFAAGLLLVDPTPLFKEKAHRQTHIGPGCRRPLAFHSRAPGPDSPPTITQSMPSSFSLGRGPRSGPRKELYLGPSSSEVLYSEGVLLVLHAYAHPNILWPLQRGI